MTKGFLLILLINTCQAFNISSWYVGNSNKKSYPIEKIRWDIITHIHGGNSVHVLKNGTAFCEKKNEFTKNLIEIAHKHNTKVMAGMGGFDVHKSLWQPQIYGRQTENFFNTIKKALDDCNIDGIEVDYEWQDTDWGEIGIIPYELSTRYSNFLARLKKTTGKIVSADISIEGVGKGEYILGFFPWINATMLNRGDFDFVNTMSYHWSRFGSLYAWKKDGFFIDLWGIDRKRVNIGIPYFSTQFWQHSGSEPTWQGLSPSCPNVAYDQNVCQETVFVGKKMNYELGKFIKEGGFRGAFPWAINYDSIEYNNSLINYLYKGLSEESFV